jgi:hypothetical protein
MASGIPLVRRGRESLGWSHDEAAKKKATGLSTGGFMAGVSLGYQ